MKAIRVGITGSNGQVGSALLEASRHFPSMQCVPWTRTDMDITNPSSIQTVLHRQPVDYLIHAAAYTAVDKAESDAETCVTVNVEGSKHVASALTGLDTKMIYISSDYVYNTYNGFPLHESDSVQPMGVYAQSKLAGEKAVIETGIPAMIVRTSWVVSSYGNNFVKTMLRLGKEKEHISVINDQYGCMTSADDLAMALLHIIRQCEQNDISRSDFTGIYNYSNEGCITWYDLAQRIMTVVQLPCRVSPILTKDYITPAPRPYWSVLSKQKIKSSFGVETPHWIAALEKILEKLQ